MKFLGIYWAGLNNFIFLPVFLIIIFFVIRNYLRAKKNLPVLCDKTNLRIIFSNFSLLKKLLKSIFLIGALILIFIALLRPSWDKKETKIAQEGRDLLIALDISRSMMAQDLKPNRLAFTKLKIRNLLEKLDFERVGLILFSGSAFLLCPLTVDHAAFLMFLDQVSVESIASGTTSIDSALNKAIEVFGFDKNRKNKFLVLATDGEDFSLNLESVKNKAKQENIKLFALGVGTVQGAPIPKFDLSGKQIGNEVDENNNIILSKLNENVLQNISEYLNGKYFKISFSDSDLDQLIGEIRKYEKEKFLDKNISFYQDKYPWLLGAAWILLALEWIL
ncbi:VWA domain-containing protein [Candidatus Babeliales bacterium]|nr:VWA domain-containing protein [Candidatus Babeliales bacterium]MCF7899731.1 VWA domain-containing protein [Candidatus Babeliales bacterium]